MLTETSIWEQSRSSHIAASRLCGSANKCPAGQPHVWTAQIGSRTRGSQCPYCCNRKVCLHNSLASVAPPQVLNTGITVGMRIPQSRCWLAANSGLSGSAQLASGNGRHVLLVMSALELAVPNAAACTEVRNHSPRLMKLILPNWLSGTMNTMTQRASIHMPSLLAATSWCTGSAHAVQEGSHTAGQPRHINRRGQWVCGLCWQAVLCLQLAGIFGPICCG